jgi:hypothetical protein
MGIEINECPKCGATNISGVSHGESQCSCSSSKGCTDPWLTVTMIAWGAFIVYCFTKGIEWLAS